MARQPYTEAIRERVIVFDGAFGTFVQGLDLGPDDFGGPSLEGCNEMLALTRPDVIEQMHRAFLEAGVDAVETASFGSFSTVLAEYDIPEKAHELNVAAASIARRVADEFEQRDGRPRERAGNGKAGGGRQHMAAADGHGSSLGVPLVRILRPAW